MLLASCLQCLKIYEATTKSRSISIDTSHWETYSLLLLIGSLPFDSISLSVFLDFTFLVHSLFLLTDDIRGYIAFESTETTITTETDSMVIILFETY